MKYKTQNVVNILIKNRNKIYVIFLQYYIILILNDNTVSCLGITVTKNNFSSNQNAKPVFYKFITEANDKNIPILYYLDVNTKQNEKNIGNITTSKTIPTVLPADETIQTDYKNELSPTLEYINQKTNENLHLTFSSSVTSTALPVQKAITNNTENKNKRKLRIFKNHNEGYFNNIATDNSIVNNKTLPQFKKSKNGEKIKSEESKILSYKHYNDKELRNKTENTDKTRNDEQINEFESQKETPLENTEEKSKYDLIYPGDNTQDSFQHEKKLQRGKIQRILEQRSRNKILSEPRLFLYSNPDSITTATPDIEEDKINADQTYPNQHQLATVENDHSENLEDDYDDNKKINYEKGGGEENYKHYYSSSGNTGDKGYKSSKGSSKGEKGHHDKETHKGLYKDMKGRKKNHKEAGHHYGALHKLNKGKKGAKFGEKGKHKKGYTTKGVHNIHKKDEYVKKHEFYDEHHEGGEHDKHGGYRMIQGHKSIGKVKSGHHKTGNHEGKQGKKGHYNKQRHHKEKKGHKHNDSHEEHYNGNSKYAEKGGHDEGSKWGNSKKS